MEKLKCYVDELSTPTSKKFIAQQVWLGLSSLERLDIMETAKKYKSIKRSYNACLEYLIAERIEFVETDLNDGTYRLCVK